MDLKDFDETTFTYEGVQRTVYRRGEGPGVVVLHELPGLTPEVVEFARRVSDSGLTAVAPILFGTPGKPLSFPYLACQFARFCLSREFHLLAKHRSSPLTDWLRGLCRATNAQCGGPGVGVVGMCVTANLVLSVMADDSVIAPVLSHPSLPLPLGKARRAALGISDNELAAAKQRVATGCGILGLRFTCDRFCPAERFERLRREFGAGFESIEIDSSPGNLHGIKQTAHSVLTFEFVDRPGHPTRAALDCVLERLRERLLP